MIIKALVLSIVVYSLLNTLLSVKEINRTLLLPSVIIAMVGIYKGLEFFEEVNDFAPLEESNIKITSSDDEDWNEMKYSKFSKKMHEPLGEGISDWDMTGEAMLNTDKWTVPLKQPPRCISQKEANICPLTTSGYPTLVKDFHKDKLVSPEPIDIKYIQEVVNNNER